MAVKLTPAKSPGPDGIFNEVLSAVVKWNPTSLLRALNCCLMARTFPEAWKRAGVTFFYKGYEKPVSEAGSFRPISLLDGVGKLLKRLILN